MAIKSRPAQSFVPVKEVRDGIVILKDGSMRMVLITSSVNFALKSDDEQAALLAQFQNFLNSLEYSTQILIQSRRLDISPYLTLLQGRLKEQLNDLMRIQIQEYIEFIRSFTESANIMTKNFFIVVPYASSNILSSGKSGAASIIGKITGRQEPAKTKEQVNIEAFEEARSQLEQRASVIRQGLARTGIRAVPLGTEEVIELYYKIFNPSDTEKPIKK